MNVRAIFVFSLFLSSFIGNIALLDDGKVKREGNKDGKHTFQASFFN
jgi:hypothetical protein